jgi:hypothetical protein
MKKLIYPFLIIVILFSHIFINYKIVKKSQLQGLRTSPEVTQITFGLDCYRLIFLEPQLSFQKKLNRILYLIDKTHPPFVAIVEALSWKVLYALKVIDVELMILITNSVFLLILLISIYGIGSILYNKNVGILSAALLSMFPAVFGQSRLILLDFPLMSMVTLSIYMLLKTKGFQSLLYSVLTGISLGLSQLTKEVSVCFFFAPLIYYFVKSYLSGNKKKVLLNFIIVVLFFMIILGIIYLRQENSSAFRAFLDKATMRRHSSHLYYFQNLIQNTGPLILILSAPLFLSFLFNLKKRDKVTFLWFAVPIILLSLFHNKNCRYLLPVYPAFVLIVSGEIFTNNSLKKLRVAYSFLLISLSILQYAFLNYGILKITSRYYDCEFGILSAATEKEKNYLPVSSKLMDIFKKEAASFNRPINILFLFDIPQIQCLFELHRYLYELPFRLDYFIAEDEAYRDEIFKIDWSEKILTADYIVDKPDYSVEKNKLKVYVADGLRRGFAKYKSRFKMIADTYMPDGSGIYVYKKTSD